MVCESDPAIFDAGSGVGEGVIAIATSGVLETTGGIVVSVATVGVNEGCGFAVSIIGGVALEGLNRIALATAMIATANNANCKIFRNNLRRECSSKVSVGASEMVE